MQNIKTILYLQKYNVLRWWPFVNHFFLTFSVKLLFRLNQFTLTWKHTLHNVLIIYYTICVLLEITNFPVICCQIILFCADVGPFNECQVAAKRPQLKFQQVKKLFTETNSKPTANVSMDNNTLECFPFAKALTCIKWQCIKKTVNV